MQVVTGKVVAGKVVLEGTSFPEGTEVTVIVADAEPAVELPPDLQIELEAALEEADSEEGISADELFAELHRYD